MDDYTIVATPTVLQKLADRRVTILEVEEANFNWVGEALIDNRSRHRTHPPTVWFCSCTEVGRILKIVGIPLNARKEFVLKSAYEPDSDEVELYENNQ